MNNGIGTKILAESFYWLLKWLPDKEYLKLLYYARLKRPLNLDNPQLFSEKMQWLKLYDRNPFYTKLADKYEFKKYVSEQIGNDHVIPLYGVWNSFDEIDFHKLPNQFVLKVTHDSGGFVVCEDKATFDKDLAKNKIEKALHTNYFRRGREWPYKNIKPRIIAEKYIPSLGKADSVEYKLTCIYGKVCVFTVCGGIPHSKFEVRTNDHFDKDWNQQHWWAYYKPSGKIIQAPPQKDEMIAFAEKLSAGIPHVRVDFYVIDGIVYVGEMTFYTHSGFLEFNPKKQDEIMGKWLELPEKKIINK